MKQSLKFRRTTLITIGLTCVLFGLGLSRSGIQVPTVYVLFIFVFLMISSRKRNIFTLLAVILLGMSIGIARGNSFSQQLEPYRQLSGQDVVFIAKVQSDAVYSYQGQLSFDVGHISFQEPFSAEVPGRISVRGLGERAVYRGDILRISGRLMDTRGSRQARVTFSSFTAVERDTSIVENVRRSFVAGISTALPEPSAPFGLGLLIGYRTTLPEITTEQLAITGLTHIIAVSGYNLTIIVRGSRRLLHKRSKYQQLVACVTLIILFLLVTDFSASIVRASIVSGLSLLAWYYGRRFKPLIIIALAAVITAMWNPLYLWSDIGWYLSFLAFFGILVISPMLVRLLYGHRKEHPQLMLILVETTAAQLMTAPLILYIFERASLIGIVSNLFIGPLVPLAMIVTVVAGVSGMAVPILAGFIALPARILLRYMLEVIAVFSRVPNALVERSINLPIMLGMYGLILITGLLIRKRILEKYGTITDNDISI